MNRLRPALLLALLPAALALAADGPTDDELRKKPVTTARGPLGDLLRGWFKHDMAAGNVGDWYDNRDREHSPLNLAEFPQLRKVAYSAEDREARLDWAWQRRVLPHVVFGNSSTSAPPEASGSNPRSFYCSPDGLPLLERQYLKNNLYIYPEHRDHDPGHNGLGGGHGDLYPTNTPYLLISQGSSGSDQPFMRALPTVLASFRPDVKKKLVETGLLMPTVQMIFRSSNSHLKGPKSYLTPAAHPTVFEGSYVDATRMARLAQSIRLVTIPPLVKLKVVEEDAPVAGRDYFDRPGATERLADTSSVIARIWRGHQHTRRLVVSARDSLDVNKAALKFHWVLLRGDPKRVTIKPRGQAEDEAEITLTYHERRPIAPGSPMESNRVDIGVFAHNGTYYSAPAFVTSFTLDSESRTYDDKGRIVEVAHGMGVTDITLPDAPAAFAALSQDELPARALQLTAAQRKELATVAKLAAAAAQEAARSRKEQDAIRQALDARRTAARASEQRLARLRKSGVGKADLAEDEKALARAQLDVKKREADLAKAAAAATAAQAALDRLLDARRPELGDGPRAFVLAALRKAAALPTLWNDHVSALTALTAKAPRVTAARQRLVQLGIVSERGDRRLTLKPARNGPGKEAERLTPFEKAMLESFHATVLADVLLPGKVAARFVPNFVDARLAAKKPWRDVYRHDGDKVAGWTRYHLSERPLTTEYTPEGWWVVERDARGRPTRARTVAYGQLPLKRPAWVNDTPLLIAPGDEVISIGYEGDQRTIRREKVRKP